MVYTAGSINSESFVVRESAAADLYHAEMELIRAEDRVLFSPNADSICSALLRFEGLASVRLDGYKTNLADLLRLEATLQQSPHGEDSNETLQILMHAEKLDDKPGLLEVYRYMQTIEWIARIIKPSSALLPKTLLHIHTRCLFGPVRSSGHVHFRTTDYQSAELSSLNDLYKPPPAADIPALIEDYCNFVNRDLFSPAAQAGISHFQLESIKPFEGKLDSTERAMSHVIFYRRGLLKSIVSPLALGPALATKAHTRYLLPYQVGHSVENTSDFINSGALFRLCAFYTQVAAQTVNVYLETIDTLVSSWHDKLGKQKKNSTAELLLRKLPGMPIVTVNSAMKLVNRGFSATNDALKLLHDCGIVDLSRPIQKNRTFIAQEAIRVFGELESRIIPGNPIARDTIISL